MAAGGSSLSRDEIDKLLFEDLPCDYSADTDIESDFDDPDRELGKTNCPRDLQELLDQVGLVDASEPGTDYDQTESHSTGGVINNPASEDSCVSPEEVAAVSAFSFRQKRYEWRRRQHVTERPEFKEQEGASEDVFCGCSTPVEFFLALFHVPLQEEISFQSNLYATQKGIDLQLSTTELLGFLGINFLMGYHQLPSRRDYWSGSPDLGVPLVSRTMSRDRFSRILSNLHLNDNSLLSSQCNDKLYKLRPLIDGLNRQFQLAYGLRREACVDESIILFKGRSSMKQYNPMKPIKRGYKIWCLGDMSGFIQTFQVYQGKQVETSELQSEFGLGGRVVLDLSSSILGKGYTLFFDNYFSSVPLMAKLKMEKTCACATIRSNRRQLPELRSDKSLTRGEYDFKTTEEGITLFKWKDNKVVYIISNYHGCEVGTVERTERDGTKITVSCPTALSDYNMFMGGIDKADMLRSIYGTGRKSKK